MSIDGRGSSPSRAALNRIGALVSERDRLKERVAVLEMLVQSTSDDRDGYQERAAELEQQQAEVRKMAELWIRNDEEIEKALINVGGTARVEQWLKLKTASNCGESIVALLGAGTEPLA